MTPIPTVPHFPLPPTATCIETLTTATPRLNAGRCAVGASHSNPQFCSNFVIATHHHSSASKSWGGKHTKKAACHIHSCTTPDIRDHDSDAKVCLSIFGHIFAANLDVSTSSNQLYCSTGDRRSTDSERENEEPKCYLGIPTNYYCSTKTSVLDSTPRDLALAALCSAQDQPGPWALTYTPILYTRCSRAASAQLPCG